MAVKVIDNAVFTLRENEMSEWKKFSEELPKVGDCFVAVYKCGSGAVFLTRQHDAEWMEGYDMPDIPIYFDADMEEQENSDEAAKSTYEWWVHVPKELWFTFKRVLSERGDGHTIRRKIEFSETKNRIIELQQEIKRLKALVGE